ncbi:carboxypeptidase N subunit 2-like isoform X7 [Dermacentor albipictus]|uniref:carboxypeptidase N subunit 2-like isoform X7 n=1 Tax=Dermacentor albipictus TaxID=60249 RepID=UPI0038FD0397
MSSLSLSLPWLAAKFVQSPVADTGHPRAPAAAALVGVTATQVQRCKRGPFPVFATELRSGRTVVFAAMASDGTTPSPPTPPAPTTTRNALTGLPVDIGEEVPVLEFLNVGRNKITTLDERSLAPLRRNGTYVYLFGNPLRCDCHLRFLVEYEESWTYSECALPEKLRGRYFGTLRAEEMMCD